MMAHDILRTAPSAPPVRLDRLLRGAYPWLPASLLDSLVASGHFSLEGSAARPGKGAKIPGGSAVHCRDIPEPGDLRIRPQPGLPLDIRHEDEDILALCKPAGQPVHPHRWDETGTLLNALLARRPALASIGPDPLFPAFLHRIDTMTSGLVLAAKTDAAYRDLRAQFAARTVTKIYHAWVEGNAPAGRSSAPLLHRTRTPCVMRPLAPGETPPPRGCFPAETAWHPVGKRPDLDATLLEIVIRSGVTHQIRCHLAAAGHPILGDRLYGSARPLPRHLLHASSATFRHPATAARTTLSAPLPPDFSL